MLGSATGRRALGAILILAGLAAGIPRATWCRAEPFEAFARTLRAPLRKARLGKVLVVVHTDDRDANAGPTPVEIDSLRSQLAGVCRDLTIARAEDLSAGKLPDSTLSEGADPAAWQPLLQQAQVDAVVDALWKPTRSGLAVRVSLIGPQKILWSGRTLLRQKDAGEMRTLARRGTGSGAAPAAFDSGNTGSFIGPFPMSSMGGWQGLGLGSSGWTGGSSSGFGGGGTGGAPGGSKPAGGTPVGNLPGLNGRILEFASSHLGQQVGGGECYELPVEAIDVSGGRPPRGNDFGDEVPLTQLVPGDILQFWSAHLVSPTAVWQLGEPGHNAIVGEVHGTTVLIYHQNVNGVRRVRQDILDLGSLVSGQIIGYRSVPR